MNKIFEFASSVSTPLALAGVVLAAVFFVLREMIIKGIFPKLSKNATPHIIRLVIEKLYILALISIIFGFIAFIVSLVAYYSSLKSNSANTELSSPTTASALQTPQLPLPNPSRHATAKPSATSKTTLVVKESPSSPHTSSQEPSERKAITSYLLTIVVPLEMSKANIFVDDAPANIREQNLLAIVIQVNHKTAPHNISLRTNEMQCTKTLLVRENQTITPCQ